MLGRTSELALLSLTRSLSAAKVTFFPDNPPFFSEKETFHARDLTFPPSFITSKDAQGDRPRVSEESSS
jgi:hypothetical protein